MTLCFTNPECWTGGSIDALMFFGDDAERHAADISRAIWSYPALDGPYLDRKIELEQQARFDFSDFGEDGVSALVGSMVTYDGHRVPFGQFTVVDDDGLWIYAGPTVGGLPTPWDVGAYPFGDGKSTPWLPPLIDQLRDMSAHVHDRFPIRAATFGWLAAVDVSIVIEALLGTIPNQRAAGISIWNSGQATYFPPNI